MGVDVAASAMGRRQMKHHLHPGSCLVSKGAVAQIALHELDIADGFVQVLQLAAGQVIRDPNSRPAGDQCINQVAANKRGSAGHQCFCAGPIHLCVCSFDSGMASRSSAL